MLVLAYYCNKSPRKGVKSEVFGNNTQLFRLAKKMTNCEELYMYTLTSSKLTSITQEQNLEMHSSVKCSAL